MPFPLLRESDSSDDDFEGIEEVPTKLDKAMELPSDGKPQTTFRRISATSYADNEAAIKAGLRSNVCSLHYRFPLKGVIEAERFPASSDFKIFGLDETNPKALESSELVYTPEDFPSGFIDMFDKLGRRWKAVAFWTGSELIYIANTNAEIRLCGALFAGSTKGGKVRWDKGVSPNNLIPGKFDKFAVSDKVLLERRKAQWPELLKQHQENCGIRIDQPVLGADVPKKTEEIVAKPVVVRKKPTVSTKAPGPSEPKRVKVEPQETRRKLNLATNANDTEPYSDSDDEKVIAPPNINPRKRKATTSSSFIVITTGTTVTKISSTEKVSVETVFEQDGKKTTNLVYSN